MTPEPQWFFSAAELNAWSASRLLDQGLWLTSLVLQLVFLVTVLACGWHRWLRDACRRLAARLPARGPVRWLERLSGAPAGTWGADLLLPVILLLAYQLLAAPLDFFTGYLLPHERGLATLGAGRFWADWALGTAQALLLAGLFGLGVFALARRLPRSWWLVLWVAVLLVLLGFDVLAPYRARLVHEFRELEPGPLRAAIERVAERAGFAFTRVEVIDTSRRSRAAGAAISGRGPSRRLLLADNLVRDFPAREVVVAVAHELGHLREENPWRRLGLEAAGALVLLAGLGLVLRRAPRWRRLGLEGGADVAALPLLLLVVQVVFLLNQPLAAWRTRAAEARADRAALRLSADPTAFCSLLVRLARRNQVDPDPPLLARVLFGSHPTVLERLRAGFAWARDHGHRLEPGALPLALPAGEPTGVRGPLKP